MFKKSLLAVAVLALGFSTVHAQLNTPVSKPKLDDATKPIALPKQASAPVSATLNPTVVSKTTVTTSVTPGANALPTAATTATVSSTAMSPQPAAEPKGAEMNPFRGRTLSYEAGQRELESAKLETSLLEERIKQVSLAEDLKTLPLKKQVEAAQATTARLKEELMQKDATKPVVDPIKALAASEKAAVKPKARPAKRVVPTEPKERTALAPKSAPMPSLEVTSVMMLGGTRIAVLDIDGNVMTVKNGDNTPLGVVEMVDNQSLLVGGRAYKVHGSTLARVVISDPKPVDPKATPALPPMFAPPAMLSGPNGAPPPATFPSSSSTKSGQPVLPPLQLPPGVTLIPPR